jgi:hypothetical protein
MTPSHSPKLPPVFRWIIWFALFNALGVYLIVLHFALRGEVMATFDPVMKTVFMGIGFGGAVLSMGIRQIVKSNTKSLNGALVAPPWVDQAFIVALAFAESPAIFGFILGIQGSPFKDYLPLFVVSAAAFILSAPAFFYPGREEN